MKLMWKFFFSIMTITQLCVSIGGYYLIQTQFNDSINVKQKQSIIDNDTLYYLFREPIDKALDLKMKDKQKIKKILSQDFSNHIIDDMMFVISNNTTSILINNVDREFADHFGKTIVYGYSTITKVVEYHDSYFIVSSTYIEKDDMIYFIDNYINIDDLFATKDKQLGILSRLIVIEFMISGMVIMFVSYRLSKPIKQLSIAMDKLSNQEYNVLVPSYRHDEIGELTNGFLKMSKQIEDYIAELKDVNKRQETFINNFTHELKTPLTSIIGYADYMRSKKLNEEEIVLSANHILNEGKRLESISKKLMQLIVLKNDEFSFYHINVKEFFDTIKDILILHTNIVMNIEEEYIYIEPDLMKNAVLNLIDNAVNACDKQESIIISGYKEKNNYIIKICDKGKGMTKENLKHIQEPFYMVDKSRTRLHGGSGLGLALVQKIIELHDADITFDSELGKGTTVTILLKGENDND